jgi:DNA-binding beta-propeller fold protein YncE
VTNGGGDSVLRIDPITRSARTITISGGPDDVTVGKNGVWVTSGDGFLTRIDPGTNEASTTDISETAPVPMGLTVDDQNRVFVTALYCEVQSCQKAFQAVLAKFDPSSGAVTSVPVPLFFPTTSVTAADGILWLTAGPELWQVDPGTGQVLSSIPIGEQFGDLAVEPGGSSVWVTTLRPGGQIGRAIQIDGSTGEIVGDQPIGCCPGAIAIDDDYVYVTNSVDGTIERISRTTGDVVPPIPVGKGVNGIAVGQGGIWVTVDR